MSKAYLFAYSSQLGDRDSIKELLNSNYMVSKWRYDMPNSFYIISDYSAHQLADEIFRLGGSKGRFIVTEIPDNSWGWLTEESWHLIQYHEYKPK
ncbi:MAG: hypothetical protein RLN96_09555 [Pseudomonadales bacterium]